MNQVLRQLLYLPEQASTVAFEIDLLHYAVILTTMAGSTAVFLVALWFTFRYRRRHGQRLTPRVRAPVWLEAGFILGLFGLFVLFWVIGFQQYVRLQVPPEGTMQVYVTAKQWMWKFAYPDGRATIATLVVPVGRPVKLIMTSRDVIHSFYVPAFRIKQDVLPGRYTVIWFEARYPGTYRIYCTEYCGTGHSKMWGDVVALDPADYERWETGTSPEGLLLVTEPFADPGRLAGRRPVGDAPRGMARTGLKATMAERGREVAAEKGCLACHTLDGQPHVGPSWRGLFGREQRLADGSVVLVDDAYLTRSMMDPLAQIAAGYPPVMPTYQGLLAPAEVGALLELIRSLRFPLPEPEDVRPPPLPPPVAPAPAPEGR